MEFWKGFFESINCEYKDVTEIKGASGINHKIIGLGVDENLKRVIISQNEQDARILAMAQADIQARMKGYNVLMIRPLPINLSKAFFQFSMLFGKSSINSNDLKPKLDENGKKVLNGDFQNKFEHIIKEVSPQFDIIGRTNLNMVPIFKELVQQLSNLKFVQELGGENDDFNIDFQELVTFNPIVYDTNVGVCPIPLYDFSMEETELFITNKNPEENLKILEKHNIKQFFYPPIDSLALGLIENEKNTEPELVKKLKEVPNIGHPFGNNEIIDVNKVNEIVDALKDKNLIVEGEFDLGITENGKEKRMKIKFTPRESIFKRISYVFQAKIDLNLKDLWK